LAESYDLDFSGPSISAKGAAQLSLGRKAWGNE
jgi:hypothetical protein